MYKKYIAVDQYGNHHYVDFPRKEITHLHGVTPQAAYKMYRDNPDGSPRHVGYVVSGHWYEVMKLSPFKE